MPAVGHNHTVICIHCSHREGLYHKLHGVHRPVAMKKSIIKRRKRVVPAPQEHQSPNYQNQAPIPTTTSGDQQSGIAQANEYQRSSNQDMGNTQDHPHPPPVDFTDYRIQPPYHQSNQYQSHNSPTPQIHHPTGNSPTPQPQPVSSALKRTFSATDSDPDSSPHPRSHRLSSISSLLNHPQTQNLHPPELLPEEIPIDPTLSTASPRQITGLPQDQRIQSQGMVNNEGRVSGGARDDPGGEGKDEKRRRLIKEMEFLSETLKVKTKELEELG